MVNKKSFRETKHLNRIIEFEQFKDDQFKNEDVKNQIRQEIKERHPGWNITCYSLIKNKGK